MFPVGKPSENLRFSSDSLKTSFVFLFKRKDHRLNCGLRSAFIYAYANTFLPFARLAAKTFLPPFVDILARNPCTLLSTFFGCHVILLIIRFLLRSFSTYRSQYMRRDNFSFFRIRQSYRSDPCSHISLSREHLFDYMHCKAARQEYFLIFCTRIFPDLSAFFMSSTLVYVSYQQKCG